MKLIYKLLMTMLKLALLTTFALSFSINAEPYLAIKNNLACSACHVNPIGGGLRNDFGRTYGQTVLSRSFSPFDSRKLARLTQSLTIGADARFNANYQKSEAQPNNTSKGFSTESAQLYFHFAIPDTGLSFYIDEQVAPGSAINREAFVMYDFGDKSINKSSYLKAGRLFVPYGLRIEDDSAFVRQVTGMNFDNSDNGVEYGASFDKTTVNLFVTNGTSQASNDDDSLLYGARIEHLFPVFRIGFSGVLNGGEQQTKMVNMFAGYQWRDVGFLAEIDYVTLESGNAVTSQDVNQLVSLIEMNYQWRQGWNFKLTAEFFDPDDKVDEDEQTRYSLVTEYTPMPNLQLRLGIRTKQDIPQKPGQNYDVVFLQSHFYF